MPYLSMACPSELLSALKPSIQLAAAEPTPPSDERARKRVAVNQERERLGMDAQVRCGLAGSEDLGDDAGHAGRF
jgi:hypothetical protein